MTQTNKKNKEKLTIKVSTRGTFKIPSTIQKLHCIDCLEIAVEEQKIILKQVKEESEV